MLNSGKGINLPNAADAQAAVDVLRAAAVSARSAAEATRPMLAKRGRAAYTGERSVGTLDAGAVAVAVLVEALSAHWAGETTDL